MGIDLPGDASRRKILERLATAYEARDAGAAGPGIRYARGPGCDAEELLALALERFGSQEVGYHVLPGWQALVESIANHLYSRQARLVVIERCALLERAGLREGLSSRLPDLRFVDATTDPHEVARADVGITSCEAIIAQTGSLVLTGRERGGLGMSLLCGVHFCVAATGQLVPDLESWLERRGPLAADEACVLVSGPSRTADIEKTVVVGVHGPWKLSVFLVKE
jgi:L-lactate utilization protein LutC